MARWRLHVKLVRTAATLAALGFFSTGQGSRAADLFRIDVSNSYGAIAVPGNDFVDLVEDLFSQQGAFTVLSYFSEYSIDINYLGIRSAIQAEVADDGETVTVSIPSSGTSVAFTGPDVDEQVEDWLREDRNGDWARFVKEVNARSPLALLDGNPRSTTALMAGSAFRKFGLPGRGPGYREEEVGHWGAFQLRVDAGGSAIDAGGFDGLYAANGSLTLAGPLGERVGLSFSALGQLRNYDGAKSYDVGLELALPVAVRRSSQDSPISWTLTPVLQSGAGVSLSLAAGGLLVGGGLVSSLSYQRGSFEVMMGNEFVYYDGIPVEDVGGCDFRTDLSQLITRNGLKLGWRVARFVQLDAGSSFTNFLASDAAVGFYATPSVGIGVRAGRYADLRVGYEADLGHGYTAHNGSLKIELQF